MAYVPNSGSVVTFQSNPANLQASVTGTVTIRNLPSVSGQVGASVLGTVPVTQVTTPWVTSQSGSIAAVIIGGSVAASFTPPANQSVSGTIQADIRGSVAAVIIGGSIAASFTPPVNQSVSGTVTVASLIAMPGIVSTANSTTATLTGGAAFTGTSEEVKDFGSIVINVFADQASATDGLSIQQSSNGTNWDITDTYTIAASTGKTLQVQPAGRFLRIVYTNGATPQGAFRLQTIYHPQMVKPTSQRAQDGYTNETDLEQVQGFGMVWNGSTWDRQRGTTGGTLVTGSVQAAVSGSVAAVQIGTRVTSIVSITPSSVLVGASIFGQLPAGTAVLGSVAALQGTNPWNVAGSVAAFQAGTQITSVSGNVTVVSSIAGGIFPVSGSVAAVVTNFPTTQNVSGSVVATQGTNPWVIGSIVGTVFVAGSVAAIGTPATSSTSSVYAVLSSITSVSILSANTARKGATLYNNAGTPVFVKLGTAATTSVFTVQMLPLSYYEVPYGWTGVVAGITTSNAGIIDVTELT